MNHRNPLFLLIDPQPVKSISQDQADDDEGDYLSAHHQSGNRGEERYQHPDPRAGILGERVCQADPCQYSSQQ